MVVKARRTLGDLLIGAATLVLGVELAKHLFYKPCPTCHGSGRVSRFFGRPMRRIQREEEE